MVGYISPQNFVDVVFFVAVLLISQRSCSLSGERRKTWWWCSIEQAVPGYIPRCWWGYQTSYEEVFCKIFRSCVAFFSCLILLISFGGPLGTLKFPCAFLVGLLMYILSCVGGVQRHCALDKLERCGFEEGGGKPTWRNGAEEMGVLISASESCPPVCFFML